MHFYFLSLGQNLGVVVLQSELEFHLDNLRNKDLY